jgi:hypothetical protein
MNPLPKKEPVDASILDAEWLMIHADRFVTDRDRIILQEKAFSIDRDFTPAASHLPNYAPAGNGYDNEHKPNIFSSE